MANKEAALKNSEPRIAIIRHLCGGSMPITRSRGFSVFGNPSKMATTMRNFRYKGAQIAHVPCYELAAVGHISFLPMVSLASLPDIRFTPFPLIVWGGFSEETRLSLIAESTLFTCSPYCSIWLLLVNIGLHYCSSLAPYSLNGRVYKLPRPVWFFFLSSIPTHTYTPRSSLL